MNETLMKSASFNGICQILENRKKDNVLKQCIIPIIKFVALMVPGVSFLSVMDITKITDTLDLSLSIIDTAEHIKSIKDSIKTILCRDETDYIKRVNNAFSAHILIVYTAYFEAAQSLIPMVGREIQFDGYAKWAITDKAIKQMYECENTSYPSWLNSETQIPGPTRSFTEIQSELLEFYGLMNNSLTNYLNGLAEFDNLDYSRREHLQALLGALPQEAYKHYCALYSDLSATYPHFEALARQAEHHRIEQLIANQSHQSASAYGQILNSVAAIPQLIQTRAADQVLQSLHNHNVNILKRPLVDKFEMSLSDPIPPLPDRKKIFVPQDFSYHYYRQDLLDVTSLDQFTDWTHGQDLIGFITHTIHNQTATQTPTLILGGPGAGKTTLTNMLAGEYLCGCYHVITIRLRDLINKIKDCTAIKDLIDHALAQLECNGSWGQLIRTNPQTPFLVIFDGYDELLLANGEVQHQFMDAIQLFQRESRAVVHTIVTSRITMIDPRDIPDGTTIIRLDGFTDDSINNWSEIWNSHYRTYYSQQQLPPLSIPEGGNARELSKQPLLLFMLALYDIGTHTLQEDVNLRQTQLYNKLIRFFIDREEKKKDKNFNEKQKTACIDLEFEKLCIAAIGMHNRNSMHIRKEQLEADLSFMQMPHHAETTGDGERLLRRFFFINYIGNDEDDNCSHCAYEFLHNSFGEFLIAQYAITCLKDIIQTGNCEHKWYATISYVPLHARPHVVQMLQESIMLSAASPESTDAFASWFYGELDRVLRGEVFAKLQGLSEHFLPDHAKKMPDNLLNHLAVYASNLVCIGTIVMGQFDLAPLEKMIPNAWDRLLRLLQLGLGLDGLITFAHGFELIDQTQPSPIFTYNPYKGRPSSNRPKAFNSLYSKMLMEPERSYLAVMNGRYNNLSEDESLDLLKTNGPFLPVTMSLNYTLNSLVFERWNLKDIEHRINAIQSILHNASSKREKESLFATYLVLKNFLDNEPDSSKLLGSNIVRRMWNDRARSESPFLRRVITELLLRIHQCGINYTDSLDLWYTYSSDRNTLPSWEYHDRVRLTATVIKDSETIDANDEILRLLAEPCREDFDINIETLPFLIQIVDALAQHYQLDNLVFIQAVNSCIQIVNKHLISSNSQILTTALGQLLHTVWHYPLAQTFILLDSIWTQTVALDISIADIYRIRPEFIAQICEDMPHVFCPDCTNFVLKRIEELVLQCGSELTLKHYRLIRSLATELAETHLLELLTQITP